MKKPFLVLGVLVGAIVAAGPTAASAQQQPTAAEAQEVDRRGEPIGRSPVVALTRVLANPNAYTRNALVVEGVVARACTSKGCWLQLAPAADEEGIRVTFKDYGFFIPLNAAGMRARAEGVVTVTRHSKKDADHLEEEGARLVRHPDGTATEISFVATGVELRP
jgi:hypothetical protein